MAKLEKNISDLNLSKVKGITDPSTILTEINSQENRGGTDTSPLFQSYAEEVLMDVMGEPVEPVPLEDLLEDLWDDELRYSPWGYKR